MTANPATPQPPPPDPTPLPKKPGRLKRALLVAAGVIVVLIILALLFLPMTVRGILRHEISAQVAGNLNATLQIDDLTWHPLLGVEIAHARLVTPGPDGSEVPVAELAGLKVSLAKIPLGGPIVIENFTLVDPTIDLVRLPSGNLQIQQNFLRPSPQPSAPAGPWQKPSDLIQVRHFAIQNMTVRLQDWKSSAPPLVAKVDVQSDLTSGPGTYSLHVKFSQDPMSQLTLDGSADVDGATLTLKNFSFTGQMPSDAALATLPQSIQDACHQYGLAGAGVTITVADGAAATVDMAKSRWQLSNFRGDIKLISSSASPVAGGVIHFNIAGGGPFPGAGVPDGLGYLKVLDHDTVVTVNADPDQKPMIASALLPHPITGMEGSLQFSNGQFALQNMQADYGSLPVQLQAAAAVQPDKVTLQGLRLGVAHGSLQVANAELSLNTPYNCSAKVSYSGIDLKELKSVLPINDPGGHVSGTASGDLTISGPIASPGISPLQSLQGSGKTHVQDADFWDLPVFSDVIARVVPNIGDVSRVGDAAAVYSFNGGTLNVTKAAVGCPLIGVQASGDIGLVGDNPLNIKLVIAPLGDWKKNANKVGIPGLGQALGKIQGAFNQVQSGLLAFEVTGPAAHYSFKAAPAPALTGGAQDVFGKMLNGAQSGGEGLLDLIQPKDNKDDSK